VLGKISRASEFAKDDHRNFNRHGEAFDRGETFSGVSLAQLALRWILEFPAVTCFIPGAKRPAQVSENIAASGLKPLSPATMKTIGALYAKQIKPPVHLLVSQN